ncbi:MAG: 50S ribosomal protein L5 [Candidatus Vogelbacteria bacterium CG22_combo_CG10-13_8_21_14_all_37_9]|uniref:Large ribosomal subunit protein uL5 n=1 Tax=Candidatus Vogelbacteria bacterium CG22_combo_CG10-13_8_21_14_all_37_9 TaxID=1975046 RepID=A0A2H0BL74_9BACT|nr:MAG: 50S ribosomal protein L5 [bacterium CG10_37_50]PIP58299.1 MAG: 50S ribosomal protein L5 [Candidatus Vogelbacteria bacterium CG22_combo_CG10-13_8_21_14_all_37_9]
MSFISVKKRIIKAQPELKTKLALKNALALPKLVKVVVNSGTGRARDKKRNELVADRLAKITGQKASARGAKKSIASFKLREGEIIGFTSTLRGKRMHDFLDRLLNIAIPRIRDFKGYDLKAIDEVGNLTIGLKEHNVFPETADEELKDIFGLSVTIVTTAKNRTEAEAFFEALGVPFKKVKRT